MTATTAHTDGTAAKRAPVLFDMDGVILRGRGTDPAVYAQAADAVVAEFDLDPDPTDRAVLHSHRCDEVVQTVCEELGIGLEAFWHAKEQYASEIANERIRSGHRTLYDDVSAIRELARDRPVALVSNNRQATVSFVVEEFGLDDLFAVVRGREPTVEGFERRKPDPFYLLETLEALDANEGIYVGDRQTDMLAAERAGLEGAFVRRAFNREESPVPEPTFEVESLAELAGQLVRRV